MFHTYATSTNKQIAAVAATKYMFPSSKSAAVPKTGNKIQEGDQTYSENGMMLWGSDNLWPQKTYELIQKDDTLGPLFKWKTDVIYGGGLVYGVEFVENGRKRFEQIMFEEVEDWLECTDIDLYLNESPRDRYSYGNFFPKFIPRAKGDGYIKELYCEDSSTCRMGVQGKNGHITKVFVNGDWKNNPKPSAEYRGIDRYGDVQAQIKAAGTRHSIMPMFLRVNGNVAYEVPTWYGLKEGGWLELSQQIPIFKKTKMANSAVLRLHVEINEKYFTTKYPGWGMDEKKYPEAEVKRILQEETTAILDSISGHDKAGKLFMSMFKTDHQGKQESMIKITRLDNEKEGGDFIEDSQESDYKKIRACGVPPVLYGSTPGAKNLAGSGSEGRVAMNHYIMTNFSDQKMILKPLQVVATMNGWHKKGLDVLAAKSVPYGKLVFKTLNYHIAKLEEGKEIKKSTDGDSN